MIRTDVRNEVKQPQEIAEKIELVGWHKLSAREQALCRKHILLVLRYLGPAKKKLVAVIHRVKPPRARRLYTGKSFLIEKHKRNLLRRRRRLGAKLTKMTVDEVDGWLKK
jgi:hypothetical protein